MQNVFIILLAVCKSKMKDEKFVGLFILASLFQILHTGLLQPFLRKDVTS